MKHTESEIDDGTREVRKTAADQWIHVDPLAPDLHSAFHDSESRLGS